jgi:hypothetical protein
VSAREQPSEPFTPAPPGVLPRHPSAVAEVAGLRHSEMKTIGDRLGRVSDFPLATIWVALATLFGGGLLGGGLGLIPFLATNPRPDPQSQLLYVLALVADALLTATFIAAALTTHHERSESISAIRADFETMLASYEFADFSTTESGTS